MVEQVPLYPLAPLLFWVAAIVFVLLMARHLRVWSYAQAAPVEDQPGRLASLFKYAIVQVRMGVRFAGHAVRGPTRVPDGGRAMNGFAGEAAFERAQFTDRAQRRERAVVTGRDAGAVVPPVFKLAQALDDDAVPFVEPAGIPVLTLLMGGSMFVQQWMTPSMADPQQQKIMMVMPVMFTFMFFNFPAGLTLYWLVNNILTIAQQWWMMRSNTR